MTSLNSTIHVLQVYPKTCIGCRDHNRAIMLSFTTDDNPNLIHDIYLTTEQANRLMVNLKIRLQQNETRPS